MTRTVALAAAKQQFASALERFQSVETVAADLFKEWEAELKHNLNAAAITSLQDTAVEIEGDVAKLIQEMEASINEANAFIDEMTRSSAAG